METTYKIINSYSVAFLGYYLKGETSYLSFLRENHWFDVMIWDVTGVGPQEVHER
jgi:hypothetical protein